MAKEGERSRKGAEAWGDGGKLEKGGKLKGEKTSRRVRREV